jgi:hypothetical protein
LRVQIPTLGVDTYFNNNNGSGYFNGDGCGSEDNPVGNDMYMSGSGWRLELPCSGAPTMLNPSFNASIIPTTGWTNGGAPINIVFTVIN